MDIGQLKPHDWLIVAAAAVMLIFGMVLDWATYAGYGGLGPFDFFFTGGLAWLLVSGTGVIAFLVASKALRSTNIPWNLVMIAATALATLLMLFRVVLGAGDVGGGFGGSADLGRGPGMFAALIATGAALGGALWRHVSSGGDLKELTDVDNLRQTFRSPSR